ncbi:MAG: hypothetical protein AAB732_02585, partial [Patescibacteria group bacterium]
MNQETKICQNCQKEFIVEPEDFEFYKKIKVPAPTFCPECRIIRRMCFKNERSLYKRKCDFSGKEIFSMFSKTAPVKVYNRDIWWSDKWDSMDYGKEYNFNKPFFEQFKNLILNIPWVSRSIINIIGSDYCNNAGNLKNCYLIFGSNYSEDSCYAVNLSYCNDCVDSEDLTNCEISYEGFLNKKCYQAFFSSHCENSYNIIFCHECNNLTNCFGCINLRNKSYYIFNKPYSKEEYFKQLDTFNLGLFKNFNEIKKKIEQFRLKFPVKYKHANYNSQITGDYIYNSKKVFNCYCINKGENLKFCQYLGFGGGCKDSYDHYRWGMGSELIYESSSCGSNISALQFCCSCFPNCVNLTYSIHCGSSSNLFGCIGLRHKQYCILNKQYTKEEYEELVPKIIEHMNSMPFIDKKGRVYKYGEFFPPELSPFCYNETIAQEYFPLTKEQAIEQGYQWKDSEIRNFIPDITTQNLPDNIKDVSDDILGKIIQCDHTKFNGNDILESTCNEQC